MADRSGYIGRNPGDADVTVAREVFTPSGVTTNFTFAAGYTVGYMDVFLNGVKLVEERDYEAGNGTSVGLSSFAQSGDILELVAYKAFNMGQSIDQITGDLTLNGKLTVTGISTLGDVVSSGIVTADSFYGDGSNLTGVVAASGGAIGVQSEGTYIGSGATTIDFSSITGTAWSLSAPSAGVATATVTPGASLGMVIALGG